ncbi:MAG: glutamyl-tRNA reductase [Actinobacteria bacterium]|nr:glutamyl-tRNA reductase [Actinomycetota bacterium]MCL6104498.1 glutamyl-tRNA reductase [Actinomycetota bacterium]
MSLAVVGLSYHSAPLELLERASVNNTELQGAFAYLSRHPNISETVVLSTCLRVEVYAVLADEAGRGVEHIQKYLASSCGVLMSELNDRLYLLYGQVSVASHLFKVAAGLDSSLLGENEILAQVRDAWTAAKANGMSGHQLDVLFNFALRAGKRVRSQTLISQGPTSLSGAAIPLIAQKLNGAKGKAAQANMNKVTVVNGLKDTNILLIGAGHMAKGVLSTLKRSSGVNEIVVANRTKSKAAGLVKNITNARAASLDELGQILNQVNVVIAATSTSKTLLSVEDFANVKVGSRAEAGGINGAKGKDSMLILDMGMPRNIDQNVEKIDGITLLDIDDLSNFAETYMQNRLASLAQAEIIVKESAESYSSYMASRQMDDLIVSLRKKAEYIRDSELKHYRSRLGNLDAAQLSAVDALTKGLVNKLLHDPIATIKQSVDSSDDKNAVELLKSLFGL